MANDLGFPSFFNHLLNTKRSVDVTFLLETPDGEIEISAHQLVLAMRSAYFADKFYGYQKENKIFRLEKVNPKAFEDMIRYCYDCKPILDTIEDISVLFGVAKKFGVLSLMDLCRTSLGDIKIEVRNVFSVLEVAEYVEEKEVCHMCTKLIEERTQKVMESYEVGEVTPAMVHIILHLPKLSLYIEYELIKWIFEWVKVKYKEESSAQKSIRECVEKLLKYLNFLELTSEELLILCKDYPDFLSSDEIVSFALNITFPGSRELPDWYDKDWKFREFIGEEIDKEIEETQKAIAVLTEENAFDETFEYINKSKECIEEHENRIKCPRILQSSIRFPIFADKNKMKTLKLMLLKVVSSEMIGTINKTAKEVFRETERGLEVLNFGDKKSSKSIDIVRGIVVDWNYSKLSNEIRIRKSELEEMSSMIHRKNEERDKLEKRLKELTE